MMLWDFVLQVNWGALEDELISWYRSGKELDLKGMMVIGAKLIMLLQLVEPIVNCNQITFVHIGGILELSKVWILVN